VNGVKARCQNCGKLWGEDKIVPLDEVRDLLQRIAPGERVPEGECPECGALCHKEENVRSGDVVRIEIQGLVDAISVPPGITVYQGGR